MTATRGRAMRVFVLAFILLVAGGAAAFRVQWNEWQKPATPYEKAGMSLSVLRNLAQEHVTFLRVQDWCRAYADNRERRATPASRNCALGDGYTAFDDVADKRFSALRRKLDDLPYGVVWIRIEYGSNGAMTGAKLAIDTTNPFRRDSLIYSPGSAPGPDIPGELENHRIDDDWYYSWEDWM